MAEQDDYRNLWDEALKIIEKDKDSQEFGMWFDMEYLSTSGNNITLGVKSLFARDQLQRRYQEYIESVLKDLSGREICINFEVHSGKTGNFPENTGIGGEARPERPAGEAKNPENPPEKKAHPRLNPDYSFDTYVIGEDRFPANAAMAVAKNPGTTSYNPLLIYGGTGLGKTHLMQAIGNFIHRDSENRIIYVSAENFTNEFVDALHKKGDREIASFKTKYRNIDVLLLDDIHFLENKSGSQEELFYTFEALYMAKKQMVFTCDRPVQELKNFMERLKSRFEQGLYFEINPPNYETRLAILKKKCDAKNTVISGDVLELIAKYISSNVRDLEGALNKMIAYRDLIGNNKPITVEIARQQLKDVIAGPKQSNLSIELIQKVVAEYFSLSHIDLKSKKRSQNIVFPRHLAMYIAREITEFSTTELGHSFGGRDHTTVISACQKMEERKKTDPTFENTINSITRMIKETSAKF